MIFYGFALGLIVGTCVVYLLSNMTAGSLSLWSAHNGYIRMKIKPRALWHISVPLSSQDAELLATPVARREGRR